MVSEQTRSAVWHELLEVARLVRYYETLSDRHRKKHRWIRFLLLGATAGGIAALLELLRSELRLFASGLLALLVVWDAVSDYARKAAVLHAVSLECSRLEIEWRELWGDANDPEADEAHVRNEIRRLARRCSEVTGWAGHADIPEDRSLNEKCEAIAYTIEAERYAT